MVTKRWLMLAARAHRGLSSWLVALLLLSGWPSFETGRPNGVLGAPAPTATPAASPAVPMSTSLQRTATGRDAALGGLRFITPVRVVDTRAAPANGTGPIGYETGAGCAAIGSTPVPAGGVRRFKLTGCTFGSPAAGNGLALPGDLTAALLNVTIIQPTASGGFVTVFAGDVADGARPNASTVNPSTPIAANFWTTAVAAPASPSNPGTIAVYATNQLDVAIDLVGYYSPSVATPVGNLTFVTPVRVVDTRAAALNGTGPIGYDAASGNPIGVAQLAPDTARGFRLSGKTFASGAGPVTFPADLSGIVAHVTIVQAQASGGYATLLPGDGTGVGGSTRPGTSTVNPSTAIAFNSWAVGVPANGDIAVYASNQLDVVIDVMGYYSPTAPATVGDLTLVTPVRVVDTRATDPPGIATTGYRPDGTPISAGAFAPGPTGEVRRYLVGGKSFSGIAVPPDATGLLINVTIVQAAASGGFVTAFPGNVADAQRPNASTVNPATAIAAGFWANGLAPGGTNAGVEAIFSTNVLHVAVDLIGYYRAGGSPPGATPTPTPPGGPTPTATPTGGSLPPDPSTVAPPLDRTVATTLCAATQFVYTGANPIQTGVSAGTIDCTRTAVLRGKVLNAAGQPLSAVTVSVLGHAEFGQTLSRADGGYDLAVNGGSLLTVNFARNGYLSAQRLRQVPWQDYVVLPDVVLIQPDPTVTAIDLTSAAPFQVARGSTITDARGTRRDTLLFPAGETATMVLANGATQPISPMLHVRATEYTAGALGPQAMPGELPSASAYTQATEFSLDEAVAAGAVRVNYSLPVISYLENFLGLPVGATVPVGTYDTARGVWVPEASGRVLKLVSLTAGLADLDLTGDGAADPSQYGTLGISDAERGQLAGLYAVGQSLWRVPMSHFSAWDLDHGPSVADDFRWDRNWPWYTGGFNPPGAPSGASGAPGVGPPAGDKPPDRCDCADDDGDEAQSQQPEDGIALLDPPLTLHSPTLLTPGRKAQDTLTIPVSSATLPTTTKRIDLSIQVAGRQFTQSLPATPNQTFTFTWDQQDAYGRTVIGKQPAIITIRNVFDRIYAPGDLFSATPNGYFLENVPAGEVALQQVETAVVGGWDSRAFGLGGRTVDVQHFYDPVGQTLYLGDGSRRTVQSVDQIITTVAGNGTAGSTGDGGQAALAAMIPGDVAVAADGSCYVIDSNRYIRHVDLAGVVTRVAGNGSPVFSGDGGPATQAGMVPQFLSVAADGSLYFSDNLVRIRRIAPNGNITTVAGNGTSTDAGDGGPARSAGIFGASRPRLLADGSLIFTTYGAQGGVVRRVDPAGTIHLAAGGGGQGFLTGFGSLATAVAFASPSDVAAGPDGTLYVADGRFIVRITPDGIIRPFAGRTGAGGPESDPGDGFPADQAYLESDTPQLAIGPDGTVYFTEVAQGSVFGTGYAAIRKITPDGLIYHVTGTVTPFFAGNHTPGFAGDGGPARAGLIAPSNGGISLLPNGGLLSADTANNRVRQVRSPVPGFTPTGINIASEDGSQLYEFSGADKHLRTYDTFTGAVIRQFGYDAAGRLVSITDGDNNVTTIAHDAAGNPTSITGPYGTVTALGVDANGWLNRVTDPANQVIQYTSTSDGLPLTKTDARGNITTFTFDALGYLTKRQRPDGSFTTLNRITAGTAYTVTTTTAGTTASPAGLSATYGVVPIAAGGLQLTDRDAAGLTETTRLSTSGANSVGLPSGTQGSVQLGPDPRFAMQAPIEVAATVSTPGGIVAVFAVSRTATLANPSNPLSLVTHTETRTLNGRTATTTYSAASRTYTVTTPALRQVTATTDAQSRLLQAAIGGVDPLTFTYDSHGRLSTGTQGSGPNARSLTFTYVPAGNGAGQVASRTDALGRTATYTYDAAGRLVTQALPGGRTIAYAYDANGNLTAVTPPGGAASTFTYTAGDLPQTYTPPGGAQTTYSYNLAQQLTQIARPTGNVTVTYDSAGRWSNVTTGGGASTAYAYSPTSGLVTGITTSPANVGLGYTYDGELLTGATWTGPVTGAVSRSYDPSFRVASDTVGGTNAVNYSYDPDDLLAQATTQVGAQTKTLTLNRDIQNGRLTYTALDGVSTTIGYNIFGEVDSAVTVFGATTLYSVLYAYDRVGRVTSRTETVGAGAPVTTTYSYDTTGRLAAVQRNSVTTASYTYDNGGAGNGNRTGATGNLGAITASYDAQDRLMQYGPIAYTYAANGELQTKTLAAQQSTYTYDLLGNLTHAVISGTTTLDYVIDGKNRRIGKKVGGALNRGWLYDGARLVAELDNTNTVLSRFVYGSRTQVPDVMIRGGTTYRLITDEVGSVRLVVDAATGTTVQQLDYDEFGNVLSDTSPGFQPFGFAGGLYDPDTGLTRFGARDYDAQTGRWTARDPLLFAGGGTNLYAYALNDPLNLIDPSGLKAGDVVSQFSDALEALAKPVFDAARRPNESERDFATRKEALLQDFIKKLKKRLKTCKPWERQAINDFIKRAEDRLIEVQGDINISNDKLDIQNKAQQAADTIFKVLGAPTSFGERLGGEAVNTLINQAGR